MGTVINPNGKPWFASASGITAIGTTRTYQTYADLLREQYPGKLAWVVDASGDPSVYKGSALYAWRPLSKTWEKLYETELMDGGSSVIQNFVGWVATPDQLREMYPNAADGWYAIVGTTDTIWVWDGDTNGWKDSSAMDGEIMWSQIVDPPSSYPITFITGLRDDLDSRVLNTTLETFYPKKADLATVATTGSYTDLTNLPDIEGITTKLDVLSGSVEETRLKLTQLSEYVDQISVDQIQGMDQYQKITDTYMQFVRPVEPEKMFLKVELFSDPSLETLIKTLDSRTEQGRLAMSYCNGTAYVAIPSDGIPVDGQGRLTAVNIGRINTAGQVYIRATWQNAAATIEITTITMHPAFTPSDMIAVGNFWRSLN